MWLVCVIPLCFIVVYHLECSASPVATPEGAASPQPSAGLTRDLRRFLLIRDLEPRDMRECGESSSEESSEESSCGESSSSSEESSSEETGEGVPCDPWDERCRIKINEDPAFKFYYQL